VLFSWCLPHTPQPFIITPNPFRTPHAPHPKADRDELAAWEKASATARSKGLFFKNLYTPQPDDSAAQQQQDCNHPADPRRQRGGSQGSAARFTGELRGTLDPEVAAAALRAAAKVTAPAEQEVGSPLRLWLFAYMAAILALVVGQGGVGACGWVGGWVGGLPGMGGAFGGLINPLHQKRCWCVHPSCAAETPRPPSVQSYARADLTTADPSLGLDALYGVLGLILGINAWNEWNERQHLATRKQEREKAQQEQHQQSPPS